MQDRPAPEPSEVRRMLDQHRVRIEQWLEHDPPLTLVRVQELLARDGVSLAYTTLRRYAHDELGWKERGHLRDGRLLRLAKHSDHLLFCEPALLHLLSVDGEASSQVKR
jgi:hypothetical protein